MNTPQNAVPVLIEKPKEVKHPLFIDDLENYDAVGTIDSSGSKGFFRYVGDKAILILSSDGHKRYRQGGETHRAALENARGCHSGAQIVSILKFDSWADLYKWLSED